MGKGKVVCVYRCDLWFLPISTICLLSERDNKHYQTGIVEESGPETNENIGLLYLFGIVYILLAILRYAYYQNNINKFQTSPG